MKLSRRTLLRGGAGAAIALPLLEATRGARALAAPPPRLVVMVNVHGTFPEKFWPTPAGTAPPAVTKPGVNYTTGFTALDTRDFVLSPILESLAPHQKDLCIVEGIDNVDGQEGHENLGALLTSWAPVDLNGENVGRGTSVDQVLAKRAQTRVPSLQLGVQAGQATSAFGCLSWYDTGKPAPNQNSAKAVFDRLFGGAGGDAGAAERLRLERKSVLDAAMAQASELQRALGAADREKLEGYLTSFRDVEARLTQAPREMGCAAPGAPKTGDMVTASANQLDLAVAALACDLTRVVTIQYAHEGSVVRMPFLGIDEPLHTVSHAGNNDPVGYEKITRVHKWYTTQFGALLDRLKAVPEGNGRLLDNTLVVWVNAMNKGNEHNNWNIPCVLAGNMGGAFRMGRFVRLPRDPGKRYKGRNMLVRGRSMGDLHATILRAMGVPTETFGDPYFFNGPLDAALLRG